MKSEEERRVIIFFLGIDEKKNKDPISKLLIESIMSSYSWRKCDNTKFLTVSGVKCNKFHIDNEIREELSRKVEDRRKCATIDEARRILDKGGRIVDSKKISLWEKLILGRSDICNSIQDFFLKSTKVLPGILKKIPLRMWYVIFLLIAISIAGIQNFIDKLCNAGLLEYVVCIVCIIFALCNWRISTDMKEEIDYFRSLNYPIIFFDETGKTERWMRNYIKRYTCAENENNPTKPMFYIGSSVLHFGDQSIKEFIVPEDCTNWGWVCLCKLIRDLAENPWGEIKLKLNIENRIEEKSVPKQLLEKEKQKRVKIFCIPRHEFDLCNQIEKQKEEFWNYAQIYKSIHEGSGVLSKLFPIGNSVYVIYKNQYVSMEDFLKEIIAIKDTISRVNNFSRISVDIKYWLIVQEKIELEIIETLDILLNHPSLDNGQLLWEDIWQYIVRLLIEIEQQDNFIEMKNLCDKVWNRRTFKYQLSFEKFYSEEREKILPYAKARRQER